LVGCDSSSFRGRAVVAAVNGEVITAEALERALALRRDNLAQELAERPEVLRAVEEGVLEELITRRLLLQEAARRGVSISREAVERRLTTLSEGYTLADYEAMLTERGLSLESFRARLSEDLTIERLLDEVLGTAEPPRPEVVEAYYRDHQGDLRRPVRVRTLHLVVSTAEEAWDLREAILAGRDFAETARRHSLGPEAVRDGELGWVSPGQMPEAFDEVIFGLKPGEVSPVVASPYGYHLFKLVEVESEGLPTLEEARPAIVARLGAEARQARYRQWVADLRLRADVVVHRRGGEVRR
ncbi:MAG: peptidyl-prolyl cis-trans isomerase, partial [Candidatus Tectimicrobiota bacterium]